MMKTLILITMALFVHSAFAANDKDCTGASKWRNQGPSGGQSICGVCLDGTEVRTLGGCTIYAKGLDCQHKFHPAKIIRQYEAERNDFWDTIDCVDGAGIFTCVGAIVSCGSCFVPGANLLICVGGCSTAGPACACMIAECTVKSCKRTNTYVESSYGCV